LHELRGGLGGEALLALDLVGGGQLAGLSM
jgi:hypothetical protein